MWLSQKYSIIKLCSVIRISVTQRGAFSVLRLGRNCNVWYATPVFVIQSNTSTPPKLRKAWNTAQFEINSKKPFCLSMQAQNSVDYSERIVNCVNCVGGRSFWSFGPEGTRKQVQDTKQQKRPLALLTQTQNTTWNVKLYVCVCIGPYLQCVLCKITNNPVVSFHGIQGHYVIRNVVCWVLRFTSQLLKVSNAYTGFPAAETLTTAYQGFSLTKRSGTEGPWRVLWVTRSVFRELRLRNVGGPRDAHVVQGCQEEQRKIAENQNEARKRKQTWTKESNSHGET